jgi:hypothetical protein
MSLIGEDGFLNRIPGFYTPELLLPSIQSILWSIHHLEKMTGDSTYIDENSLIKTMQSHSHAGKYAGLVTATESCSQPHLASAITSLKQLKVVRPHKTQNGDQIYMPCVPEELLKLLIHLNRGIINWQFSHLHYTDPAIFQTSSINAYQVH